MLKIQTEERETRLLTMTVEVAPERLESARRAAARRLSQRVEIPGFRKGKAPFEIVRRQFGDGALNEEALENLGQEVYKEALEEGDIDPILPGSLEDVKFDPLVLTYSVPLRPSVDLGDYRSIRLEFQPEVVSEERFQEELEHLREHQAVLDPVERPAVLGDVVVANVSGQLISESAPAEQDYLLDDRSVSVIVEEGLKWPVPGFAAHLVGMSAGEHKSVDYTFPEDYANEELRGKPARFNVQVLEVKSRYLPEWSDNLAQAIGDYETLLDLRLKLRAQLQEQANREAEGKYASEVFDQVVAGAKVEFPRALLEEEVRGLVEDLDVRLKEQGLKLEDYLKLQNKSREELALELEPDARRRLTRSLVLYRVMEVENISVDDSDLDQRAEALSGIVQQTPERVKQLLLSDRYRPGIVMDLLRSRTLERLAAIARGENPEIEPAAEEAPPLMEGLSQVPEPPAEPATAAEPAS